MSWRLPECIEAEAIVVAAPRLSYTLMKGQGRAADRERCGVTRNCRCRRKQPANGCAISLPEKSFRRGSRCYAAKSLPPFPWPLLAAHDGTFDAGVAIGDLNQRSHFLGKLGSERIGSQTPGPADRRFRWEHSFAPHFQAQYVLHGNDDTNWRPMLGRRE